MTLLESTERRHEITEKEAREWRPVYIDINNAYTHILIYMHVHIYICLYACAIIRVNVDMYTDALMMLVCEMCIYTYINTHTCTASTLCQRCLEPHLPDPPRKWVHKADVGSKGLSQPGYSDEAGRDPSIVYIHSYIYAHILYILYTHTHTWVYIYIYVYTHTYT